MAAPVVAVVVKKAAAILLADKRTWTVIGSVIGAIVAVIVIAVTVIFGGISARQTAQQEADEAVAVGIEKLFTDGELPEDMPQEYKDGLQNLKNVFDKIEEELEKQSPESEPIKAQIILLCALSDRVDMTPDDGASENFYADYASCFVGVENDGQIFDNITAKFGVEFTDEDRQNLIALYTDAIESQAVPPGSIHNEIKELAKNDASPLADGDFLSPFRGVNYKDYITSGFGYRTDPVTGEEGKLHTGLDIGMPAGTDIYAVKAGTVLFVRLSDAGYGNHLAVYHGGGYVTLYAHCSEILVSEGDEVTTDTVIARVGSTGKSTGPHIHIEVCVDGIPQNPKKFLP